MSKLIWESPGGTFRLLDKRVDLPRPLLELVHGDGGAMHLTPEDVDELWGKLTSWLHGLEGDDWDRRTNGVLELIRRERAQLEREFADRLSKLDERADAMGCPFCTHNVDLHVNVDVGGKPIIASQKVGDVDVSRRAKACSIVGCSCVVIGQEAPRQESAAAES